jgi:hypothetical protein
MDAFDEGEEQIGSYSIFFAEGEALAKQGQYKKAIESFTKVTSRLAYRERAIYYMRYSDLQLL